MPSQPQCVLTGVVYDLRGTVAAAGTKLYVKKVEGVDFAHSAVRTDFVVNADGALEDLDGDPASLPQGASVTLNGSIQGFQTDAVVVIPELSEYEFRLLVPGSPPTSTSVNQAAFNAHMADTSTHGVGEIVGRTESQTLTNKTLPLGGNTLSGTLAQFNAALSDADFASQAYVDAAVGGITTEAIQDLLGSTSFNSQTPALTVTYDDPSNRFNLAIASASGAQAGLMSAADKSKLDGVATGATANSSDATLLARANHTGTQAAATISDFASAAASAAPAETAATVGALVSGAADKATPVDADTLGLSDSAASGFLKKLTWANLKATLKTYFDTLYQPLSAALTSWAAKAVPAGVVVGDADTQTLSNKTLTAPRFATAGRIDDASGNELVKFPATITNAVNEITVSNAATGSGPEVSASGGDTNIDVRLTPKGTGYVRVTSGGLVTPFGSSSALAVSVGGRGFYGGNGALVFVNSGGVRYFAPLSTGVGAVVGSDGVFGFSASTDASASPDTGITRAAAGVVQLPGLSSAAVTPGQLTADANNYAPGVGMFQRWSSDASRNVTGMAAGADGAVRYVWNVGSQNIVLQNENASSTAANRFLTATGADLTLGANKCALAQYDATSSRWRVTLLP